MYFHNFGESLAKATGKTVIIDEESIQLDPTDTEIETIFQNLAKLHSRSNGILTSYWADNDNIIQLNMTTENTEFNISFYNCRDKKAMFLKLSNQFSFQVDHDNDKRQMDDLPTVTLI